MDQITIKKLFDKSIISKPNILDGACGCFLQESNPELFDNNIWMTKINTYHPENVKNLAYDYLKSGANLITTNTFRTNPSSLQLYNELHTDASLNSISEVKKALEILLSLRYETKSSFLIAGSNPPSHDCYTKTQTLTYEKIKDNHINHIKTLHENGADLILNETQSFLNEIEICQKFCFQNNINYIVSLYINEDLTLNSGEYVFDILHKIDELSPLAISFNCINEKTFQSAIQIGYKNLISLKSGFGYYLNCGNPDSIETNYLNDNFNAFISPKNYADLVKSYEYLNPVLVGACCMSTPEHINQISNLYSNK
jgi:S-methylmethionine-dependent homocysteine/selenocysteine methylase